MAADAVGVLDHARRRAGPHRRRLAGRHDRPAARDRPPRAGAAHWPRSCRRTGRSLGRATDPGGARGVDGAAADRPRRPTCAALLDARARDRLEAARHRAGLASSPSAAFDRGFYPEGTARQLAAILASPDRTEALGAVRAPTVVIHGCRRRADRRLGRRGDSRRDPRVEAGRHPGPQPRPAAVGARADRGRATRELRAGPRAGAAMAIVERDPRARAGERTADRLGRQARSTRCSPNPSGCSPRPAPTPA